ncbi:MAG TPA: 3-hydroxyacyl-ACP dehydratase FabZ [Candidatus Sumerlaeota bacterium]|nr:3-hydroxyacyl-ACP dehydratase FabZ [Candidatus Sumerlaeota bacterium]HNM45964.1 3-hydroxyacyl-ACP dehydratase FabZ [Candidatus Sumerlaeota bacterium]
MNSDVLAPQTSTDVRDLFIHFPPFDCRIISRIIPHRHPFLLPDGITEFTHDGVKGFKNISISDPVFQGHFPGEPVYPGVLQIETVAQIGACWILARKENVGKIAYLMSVEEAKFRRAVTPGMRLDVVGKITNLKSRTGRLSAEVLVDGKVVSNVTILFAFQRGESDSASGNG